MLQRQLGETVPIDCNNRRQRHVPTRCLLHRFFHVPTSGEEDHALWCIILGIFWNPTYRSPAWTSRKILNVYVHHQLISTINMYDICRLYADMSDMLWMIVTDVDSKDLGMPVGTRSNHPSICLWSSCLSPQSPSLRHPSPLWTPRNASWPPLYSVSLSDRCSCLSLRFSFGSKWKKHTKTK